MLPKLIGLASASLGDIRRPSNSFDNVVIIKFEEFQIIASTPTVPGEGNIAASILI